MFRWKEHAPLRYASPSVRILVLALVVALIGIMILLMQMGINSFREMAGVSRCDDFTSDAIKFFVAAIILAIIAAVEQYTRSDIRQIRYMVRARLCDSKYGNPLSLRDGQMEPEVAVSTSDYGYKIRVRCASAYAVVTKEEHIGGSYVDYYIDDETENARRQDVYDSIDDLRDRYV